MTEQTQPTDAELLPLIEKHLGLKPRRDDTVINPRTGRFHDVQRYRDFARAVLAKWGTPAGAGEVVAWQCRHISDGSWQECNAEVAAVRANRPEKWEVRSLFTTPQPTQAQAGFKSGAKSFQTYAEANAYSKGYYAGKKAATKAQAGAVVITTDADTGQCVAVTRQDDEGRVLSVIWQASEAQAGAVPLTDEWIRAKCKEPWIFETAKQWIRIAEASHGIKGADHG
jgi:hypothetical protein